MKGIREKAKKIGSKNNKSDEPQKQLVGIHIPQHTRYKLGDIFYDLLSFAAEHLNSGKLKKKKNK